MIFTKYILGIMLLISQYSLYSQQRMELILGSGWDNRDDEYLSKNNNILGLCKVVIDFNGKCIFNDSIISNQAVGVAKCILLPLPKEKLNELKIELNGVKVGEFYFHKNFFRKRNLLLLNYLRNQQSGYIQIHLVKARSYVFL